MGQMHERGRRERRLECMGEKEDKERVRGRKVRTRRGDRRGGGRRVTDVDLKSVKKGCLVRGEIQRNSDGGELAGDTGRSRGGGNVYLRWKEAAEGMEQARREGQRDGDG